MNARLSQWQPWRAMKWIDKKKQRKRTFYNHKTGYFNEKDKNSQKPLSVDETAASDHKENYIFRSVLGHNRSFVSCDKLESSTELLWWECSFDWLSWKLNPRTVENFCALYFQPAQMLAFFEVQSSHQKKTAGRKSSVAEIYSTDRYHETPEHTALSSLWSISSSFSVLVF